MTPYRGHIRANQDNLMAVENAIETQLATARTPASQLLEAVISELTNRN